ncbi:MAG: hypothetical protein NXH82_08410 [Rhodobacteraceae bacterium]|nr:hypothetical protein [Paracoccaceae bacterium]
MTDLPLSDKNVETYTLGCDPQVDVRVTQTPDGALFFSLSPTTFNGMAADIDGLFLSLSDESTLSSINFFPDLNVKPVTGQQAEINAVNTLSNGAMTGDDFDIGLQFGLADNSTLGLVTTVNFTLWSDDGPLMLDDLNLEEMQVIVNSDLGEGQVLKVADAGATQTVETTLLEEDFDGLHEADDSDNILRDGRWDIRNDKLFTNGSNDGYLKFAEVQVDGPAKISFDIEARNVGNFEADGHYADSLKLQVKLDDGTWQTLDKFVVNDAGTALVGSVTGQSFGHTQTALSYEGGILDDATQTLQVRFVSDISANDEKILIDNFAITATEEVPATPGAAVKVDFDDLALGDTVSDQYDGLTIEAQRADGTNTAENDAMIFDTERPTGGDHDLAYDNQGNALIISEDNDATDPDDEAHGGTITFDFDDPAEIVSVNFLDIEERGGTVDLFDTDGALLSSFAVPVSGDNGQQELQMNVEGVSSMEITLVGSGAVDDLCYVPGGTDDCSGAQHDVSFAYGFPMVDMNVEEKLMDLAEEEDDMLMIA